jgi:N-acetylneuraminic acid mutarotase
MSGGGGNGRQLHGAVLLGGGGANSGKVLLMGGTASSTGLNAGLLQSAELFNPADGSFTATAPMPTGRNAFAFAGLPNGNALVVGGLGAGATFTNSAEIFDAGAATWSAPSGITGGRNSHTATTLPDGRILVTGGVGILNGGGNSACLASCQVYDPATGTWTATASLGTARSAHTATLIPGTGKVLVTGGTASSGASVKAAEIWDPAGNAGAGAWSSAGNMVEARSQHAAIFVPTLGKVLVVGGQNGAYSNTSEVYDPALNTWTLTTGQLSEAKILLTPVLVNGKVILPGGTTGSTTVTAKVEVFDPSTQQWSTQGTGLTMPRGRHTATALSDGRIVVAGGFVLLPGGAATTPAGWSGGSPNPASPFVELYSLAQNASVPSAALQTNDSRQLHCATLLPSGKVLLVTGSGSISGSYNPTAEVYDPAQDTLTVLAPLTTGRSNSALAQLPDGGIAVIGGTGADASVEIYK